MTPDTASPTPTTVLDDLLSRIASAVITETYSNGREKENDDTVLGTAPDHIKRLYVVLSGLSAELKPLLAQSEAIAERIQSMLPEGLRSMDEIYAAVQADETMRLLHEDNTRLYDLMNPLHEMQALLNNLIAVEVMRAYSESRKHSKYGSLQMSSHWEVVALSPRAMRELRMQQAKSGLLSTDDGIQIVIMGGVTDGNHAPNKTRLQ